MMSSKSTLGQRSVIVTNDAILIFKYTSSTPYFSSFSFPVRWMKMKRHRLSPLLSQRASESWPVDAVRYRRNPSAEVTPKVTSQKDDEKINLSQWEKNTSVCVRAVYRACGWNDAGIQTYVMNSEQIQYCWESRHTGVNRALRQSHWCGCHRNQGRRAQVHVTQHNSAFTCTQTHTFIVILAHFRLSAES